MSRMPLQSLLVITVAGALVSGLHAQNPKPIKPVNTTIQPMHPPSAPPAPSASSSSQQGSALGPICRPADLVGHWETLRSLAAACINKQVSLDAETQNYEVIVVNETGFVLKRVFQAASDQQRGREATRFVPWSALLYFGTVGDFVNIKLVNSQ
jgi:hypothetical protein